jgi:hypothetical protein
VKPDLTLDDVMTGAREDGGFLDLLAKIHLSIGSVREQLADQYERRQRLIRSIHPVTVGQFPVTLSAGAGGLDLPDLLGPHGGYVWDVHMVIASGFTAGSVAMFTGGTNLSAAAAGQGNLEFNFTSAGQLPYGKLQLLLMPNDRLTFWATGITGQVNIKVRAVEMEIAAFPEYAI